MIFFDEEHSTRDVDCVLTSTEIDTLLIDTSVNLAELPDAPLDPLFSNANAEQTVWYGSPDTGASGGYLENVFRFAAKALFDTDISGALEYKRGRNADWQHVSLEVEGKEVLRFVRAYGFRNIQNVMRALKKGNIPFHYVEIMACPSGCLNGGGQIKLDSKAGIRAQKRLVADLDQMYHEREVRAPTDNPRVGELYRTWIGGEPGSQRAAQVLHTQYHHVAAADINPLAIKW